jgi:hypothetical protein
MTRVAQRAKENTPAQQANAALNSESTVTLKVNRANFSLADTAGRAPHIAAMGARLHMVHVLLPAEEAVQEEGALVQLRQMGLAVVLRSTSVLQASVVVNMVIVENPQHTAGKNVSQRLARAINLV